LVAHIDTSGEPTAKNLLIAVEGLAHFELFRNNGGHTSVVLRERSTNDIVFNVGDTLIVN
jgi:hypothetical protein